MQGWIDDYLMDGVECQVGVEMLLVGFVEGCGWFWIDEEIGIVCIGEWCLQVKVLLFVVFWCGCFIGGVVMLGQECLVGLLMVGLCYFGCDEVC